MFAWFSLLYGISILVVNIPLLAFHAPFRIYFPFSLPIVKVDFVKVAVIPALQNWPMERSILFLISLKRRYFLASGGKWSKGRSPVWDDFIFVPSGSSMLILLFPDGLMFLQYFLKQRYCPDALKPEMALEFIVGRWSSINLLLRDFLFANHWLFVSLLLPFYCPRWPSFFLLPCFFNLQFFDGWLHFDPYVQQ